MGRITDHQSPTLLFIMENEILFSLFLLILFLLICELGFLEKKVRNWRRRRRRARRKRVVSQINKGKGKEMKWS